MLILVYTLSGKPNSVHDSEDGEADGKEICVRNSLAWPDPAAASQVGLRRRDVQVREIMVWVREAPLFKFYKVLSLFLFLCFLL